MFFIVVLLLLFAFWLFRGRGWWVVYRHKEEWIELPAGTTREQLMETLKKDFSYQYSKEIYYDENGNVAIVGKHNTYPLILKDDRVYVSGIVGVDPGYVPPKNFIGKLSEIGHQSNRFSKENAKCVEEAECIHAYILKIFNHDAPIDTRAKFTTMKRAANYTKIAYATVLLSFALLVVVICNKNGLFDMKTKQITDSYFTEYSSTVTIGDAFEDFFANPKWESYKEGIQDYVDFQGECEWGGEEVTVVITFLLNEDSFIMDSLKVDGEELPLVQHYLLLEAIYSDK